MKKDTSFPKAAGKPASLPTAILPMVLLVCGLVVTAPLALAGPLDEQGETKEGVITLTEDTWADGAISSTSGEQWFKFTATAGTQYLHVFFGTLTNLYVQLHDSKGNALGDAARLGGDTTYRSLVVTSGQVYYVRVTPYSSTGGTYRIGFNTMPLALGTLSAAATLTPDTWADGVLTPANGEQWFTFTATAGTQYLHIVFGTLTYLYVQLYDGNGNALGEAVRLGGDARYRSLLVTNGQVYYIRVMPYNSNSGTYRIGFNAMPLPCGTLAEAAVLTQDAWIDGFLTPANGEQWFTFTATAGTQYLHVLFGTLTYLYIQLYDSNGNALGEATRLGGDTRYRSLMVTNGQVYYIRIMPYNSNSGTYRIGFNTSATAPGTD